MTCRKALGHIPDTAAAPLLVSATHALLHNGSVLFKKDLVGQETRFANTAFAVETKADKRRQSTINTNCNGDVH